MAQAIVSTPSIKVITFFALAERGTLYTLKYFTGIHERCRPPCRVANRQDRVAKITRSLRFFYVFARQMAAVGLDPVVPRGSRIKFVRATARN
jgi:hypothetical protein